MTVIRVRSRAHHLVASITVMLAGLTAVVVLGPGPPSAPAVIASRPNGTLADQVVAVPVTTVSGERLDDGATVASQTLDTPVGSSAYAVPAGAIVVATTGTDTAPGTAEQPVGTVARALELVPIGGTIVVRAGSYHESLTITTTVTIQAWPEEAVWFDGSTVVSSWVQDGSLWRSDAWTVEFDSSPTYTRGAPDSTEPGWKFVDDTHPMAAHPDQIWVDGIAQRQVSSLAEVGPGTFFHDEPADRLYLGTDPTNAEVRASDLVRAMAVRAEGVVLRGFGIRRYAPSVPDIGAVTLERAAITVEQLAIIDSATTGLSVVGADITVRNVYVARSGMLGVHGNHADSVVIEGLVSEGNNTEHFNSAPVSGGLKITRSRGVTVRNSIFRGNDGPGLWLDESVHDMQVVGNEMRDNAAHGAVLEISAKAVFADNIVQGNGGHGLKVNNVSDVAIWNNTFVGNGRSINLVQDARRYGDGSPGKDPRDPNDPTMSWLLGPVTVANNVVANQLTSGDCMLCVEDYSKQRTADQIGVTADGNVYNRPTSTAPSWAVVWSNAALDPAVFTTIDAFRTATGQEASGVLVTGSAVVTDTGDRTQDMPAESVALPLPADIAAMVGRSAGTQHVGAW